jgi:hypothetical protein
MSDVYDLTARRGFLRSLVSLPMLGGGVALIGAPHAVAEPIITDLMQSYRRFLTAEVNLLSEELPWRKLPQLGPRPDERDRDAYLRWCYQTVATHDAWTASVEKERAITRAMPVFKSRASTRAALVMSAVGFDWRALS